MSEKLNSGSIVYLVISQPINDVYQYHSHGVFTNYTIAAQYANNYKRGIGDLERVFISTNIIDPPFDEYTSFQELRNDAVEVA